MLSIVGVDSETYAITDGMLAPKPVCWSFDDGVRKAWLERGAQAFQTLHELAKPGNVWACSNFPYDAGVAGARDASLLTKLFDLLERGEVHDVEVAATLDAIAEGRMTEGTILDRDGQPLRRYGDHGPATNRIKLENAVWLYLGRRNAKENDEYRLLYGQLDDLPTDQWPESARQYPLDDATNQREVAIVQRKVCKNIGPIGMASSDPLPSIRHSHLTHQSRAHFIMHLGSIYGLRTDAKRIAELEAEVTKVRAAGDAHFRALGFIKTEAHAFTRSGTRKDDDGKDNVAEVKRRVVVAFGGSLEVKCGTCHGTTKVKSDKSGADVNCKACNATGLDVPPQVPRTPSGGICGDRDILKDSADQDLIDWAAYGEHDKMEQTYLPWLKKGVDKPINVRANILVSTARSSYDGLLQLIPPLARECVIAPEGYDFCSIDLAAGELCTLAQVHVWLFNHSKMADAINSTGKPGQLHSIFGAKLAGISDAALMAEFIRLSDIKGSREAGLRQLAKVGNFGFPGMMGPAKLVISARRKGDRLCVIAGMNQKCRKGVLEWNGKALDRPTCPDCLEVAANLKVNYLETWDEMPAYFNWVKGIEGISSGMGTMVSPGTGFIRGGLNASAAANHPFQHLLAMAKKQAMWLVGKEAYCDKSSPLFGTKIIGDIHDELLTLIPKTGHQHEAAFRKKELIIQGCKQFVPDVAMVADDPCLMSSWQKKAVAVYDGVPTPTRPKGTLKTWAPTKKAA